MARDTTDWRKGLSARAIYILTRKFFDDALDIEIASELHQERSRVTKARLEAERSLSGEAMQALMRDREAWQAQQAEFKRRTAKWTAQQWQRYREDLQFAIHQVQHSSLARRKFIKAVAPTEAQNATSSAPTNEPVKIETVVEQALTEIREAKDASNQG